MPPADEHHAEVQHDRGDHHEIADAAQADDAALEILKLRLRTPPLDGLRDLRILDDPIGDAEHGQRQVEDHAQDEADRQVAGQKRRDHADREHRQADEPVADVRADEQARCPAFPGRS